MKNRKGYIVVSEEIMWNFEVMKVLYSEFFPFHIEYEHWTNRFKIYGVCERFDELKEGETPRQYDFIIKHDFEKDKMFILECN